MRSLNTSHVAHKAAFLGKLTSWVRHRAAELAEGVSGRVLDIGCGNGLFFADLHSDLSAKLFGVDRDMALLREAQRIFLDNEVTGIGLICADMYHLPFKERSLDTVIFLNTLLNVPARDQALRLLESLLTLCRPGGRIILDIRNGANWYMRIKYWRYMRKSTLSTLSYNIQDISSLLENNGFTITRIKAIGIPHKWTAFAYALEARSHG